MNGIEHDHYLSPIGILHGKNVYLRKPQIDELVFIRRLWGDRDTMAPVGGPIDLPDAKAKDWFARMIEPGSLSNCYFLIFTDSDLPVGEISFHNWNPDQRSAHLNVKILASCRGHGYAKDALRRFLKFFFLRVGGQLMIDDVAPDNHAGQQLLRSIGFEEGDTVSQACRLMMTKPMYERTIGQPEQTDTDSE